MRVHEWIWVTFRVHRQPGLLWITLSRRDCRLALKRLRTADLPASRSMKTVWLIHASANWFPAGHSFCNCRGSKLNQWFWAISQEPATQKHNAAIPPSSHTSKKHASALTWLLWNKLWLLPWNCSPRIYWHICIYRYFLQPKLVYWVRADYEWR